MRAAAALLLATGLVAGCERAMRDMYAQPRLGPDAASPLFADGKGSRPPPADSLPAAMGELAKSSGGRRGREEPLARAAADAAQAAPPATPALLARGRERYGIACEPCHSPVGDGDGLVARRGFPRPPDYAEPRLRAASDRELYDAITHGYGVMPALADRLGPQDRWAVVAYVRALQLARSAPLAELPPALREAVRAMPRASAASEAG